MNNPNFDFLKSKFNVSEGTFAILQSLATKKKLIAGEKTVRQGGMDNNVHFLTSGLMRAVQTLESGKTVTKNIFPAMSFVAPFSSMLKKEPSLLCYEALTDCKVFEINFDAVSSALNFRCSRNTTRNVS